MGDSSRELRGSDRSKARLSCEEGLGIASFAIVQETPGNRRHHHSRTRSTGHTGSTLSLNSSGSFHKFCNQPSPVSTPKFGRHDFCIPFGSGPPQTNNSGSTASLSTPSQYHTGRMVRQSGAGYHSKPNSPIPSRRTALIRYDTHQQHSDTSDNSSHMSSSSSSGSKTGKGKKAGTTSTYVTVGGGGSGERQSVHKQNLYVVSYPLILLFNIFRSLLYQLFVLLRYVYCAAAHRRQQHAEQQRQRREQEANQSQLQVTAVAADGGGGGSGSRTRGGGDTIITHQSQQPQLLETSTIVNNLVDGSECAVSQEPELIMNSPRVPPGPADPLLAKQKHHHRRAFEYISKALKIDEENEGE